MKKYLLVIPVLALLFACNPENTPSDNNDNGNGNGGNTEVVATAIKLSCNDLTLEKGANEILTVTYTPSNTTKKDITWVSSNTSIATVADGIVVGVAPGSTEIIAKCGDAADKCKVSVVISATGIMLNSTSLELVNGDSETLVATVEPEGSTDRVTWETSDEAVATVADGVVTAVRAGEAIITAKAGTQNAKCKVMVSAVPHGAVDLGIVMTREDGTTYKLYWAKSNLSMSGLCANPEDFGDSYAWGETEPKEYYDWSTYKWCNGNYDSLTKYNTSSDYGTVDNKSILDPEDDVVHVILEGKWRMPTFSEWTKIKDNCTWTWTSNYNGTGVAGMIVTSNVAGYTDKSIFLPAAGDRDGANLDDAGSYGLYWSSSLNKDYPRNAKIIQFNSEIVYRIHNLRFYGFSIRPVTE